MKWGYSSSPWEKLSSSPEAGRRLPAVEHDVADADRLQGEEAVEPRVKALVAPAEQRDVLFEGQLAHEVLGGLAAVGRHAEHAPGAGNGRERIGYRSRLHDHARASAVGSVVHMPVPVRGKAAGIVEVHADDAGLQGPAHEARLQAGVEKGGKERNDVEREH